MGDMVIVAYRAKPGQEAALQTLVKGHVPYLRRLGLATDRPALAMQGQDGVIVEVFEWHDGATAKAHAMPEIQAMWEEYAAVCDYAPLQSLPESLSLFATFKPLDF